MADDLPDVSIALLTHNAGPLLERVLQAIRSQKTGRRVELVAIDTASADGSRERLEAYGANVETIAPETFNFGATRDLLFERARGAFIVSLSQDAVPAQPDWLEKLLAPFDDPSVGVSCGRSVPDPDRAYPQFPWEANGGFYFTAEMRAFRKRHGLGLSNANAAYRRFVWDSLRFGSQPIGEDFLFQTKLAETEYTIAFQEAQQSCITTITPWGACGADARTRGWACACWATDTA